MNVKKNKTKFGFTLIETLIAVTILLIAVVGPIALIGDSIRKMYYARDEALAINLAQEGIEMVRQVRDSNMLSGSAWLTTLADGTYMIDAGNFMAGSPSTFVIYCGAVCIPQPIYIDSATGLYRQGTVFTSTRFSRIVTISGAGLPANERQVTSTVTWLTGGSTGSVSVSEYVFSWAI